MKIMAEEKWEEDIQKYIEVGLFEPGMELIDKILKEDPKNRKALTYRAYIYRSMDRDKEALDLVNSLLEDNMDDIDLLLLKGMILFDNENYKNAAKYFRRVHEIDEKNTDALYNLASCYDAMDQLEYSGKYYKEIVNINPEDEEAWNNLAVSMIFQEKYKEALEAAKKSISIDSEYDNAWYNKGLALYYLEKYKDALKAFDRSIELSDDSDAWYAKGICYAAMDMKEEAIRALKEALKRNPEDPEIKESLKSLQSE